jgi:ABC-type nitrate/sulfonate/bicarbonate transport system permease component
VWYVATEGFSWVQPLNLPGPGSVADRIVTLTVSPYLGLTIWGHALASIKVVMIAWAIAGLLGVPVGIAMAWSIKVRRLVYPIFQLLRPVSPIAWIPLGITWFGIGVPARVFIDFIAAVVPWVVSAMSSVEAVDVRMVQASRNLGASSIETLRRVVLPSGLPTLLGGARIALGNAWTAVIAAELLGASEGLGFVALNAGRTLDSTTTVAAMVVIGIIGVCFSIILTRVARSLTPWRRPR